ncbi:DUF2147 domain-containing protein [Chryseobacterium taklimakanense]|uniref:DUF2147 domain-containing protein n=1 Tax=Chryseobacterium taklimakanense TaxID=536441 RepID=A0A3G8WZ21_9FLAO|nr:DUF2147 domain-containing protein [Chryseobacterium taklimakanense]AZI21026.1 DUF2147 domain-containing protein [Chryseobacterium taklimakanense]AZI22107.1 DUF2147 domain-containing protein [Chryseobacterium taklimakanense]MCG7281140.1 DUF2147 domain-containing protein [Chryseobacterium taklimakanense]
MKKMLFAFIALFFATFSFAQIEGKWKTIDDETGKPKSIVEIFKKSDGKYYGRISQLLIKPENNNCVKCKDDRKNKPLVGLEIIRGLKKDGNEFTGGTITNPKDGKTYNTAVVRNGNTLAVKAIVLGIAVKTQTWHLVK